MITWMEGNGQCKIKKERKEVSYALSHHCATWP